MIANKTFTGEFPRVLAHNLPHNAAQFAEDCDFSKSNLVGLRALSSVSGVELPQGTKTIFEYSKDKFYTWPSVVSAVKSTVTDDLYDRFYWSDGQNLRVSRATDAGDGAQPSVSWLAGVPQPMPLVKSSQQRFLFGGVESIQANIMRISEDGSAHNVTPFLTADKASWSVGGDTLKARQFVASVGSIAEQHEGMILFSASVSVPVGDISVHSVSNVETTVRVDDKGAALPTPVTRVVPTTVTTVTRTRLGVEVFFRLTGGVVVQAVLREGGDHTWPGELYGYSGDFSCTFSGNRVSSVNLRIAVHPNFNEMRAYARSFVNEFGEEGTLSDPIFVTAKDTEAVMLEYPSPTGIVTGYVPVTKIRLYRTATGANSTAWLFVSEVGINTTGGFIDDGAIQETLGESATTVGFYPPVSGLGWVTALPNGMLAGFVGDTVYFSQPYLPYAWVPDFSMKLESSIVGLCAFDSGLYAITDAHPVFISGVSPDAMTAQKLPAIQAGVSPHGIVNAGGFVAYATNDGIATLRGIDASLDISNKFFTRSAWRDLYADRLEHINIEAHDGMLLVWFSDGGDGFAIRYDDAEISMTRVTTPIEASYTSVHSDSLRVVSGGVLYDFSGGDDTAPFVWHSKDFIVPVPISYGGVHLIGQGVVDISVYGDGDLIHTTSVELDKEGFSQARLPGGRRCRRWSVRIVGAANATVLESYLCVSFRELKNA